MDFEDPTHRGRKNHMDRFSEPNLSGTFLAPIETTLCVKLHSQHWGTGLCFPHVGGMGGGEGEGRGLKK